MMTSCESRDGRKGTSSRVGAFTLIELMVVMGIIILAAGLMTPTIAEFFRNKALDSVRGEFGSVFNRARLQAVTQGRDFSVVFFREGGRIYDEKNKFFADADWAGDSSALGDPDGDLWYVLGCADNQVSLDPGYDVPDDDYRPSMPCIPPYTWFVKRQEAWRKKLRSNGVQIRGDQFDVSLLAKVTFHRDGTMTFGPGCNDVSSAEWRREPAINADIKIYQQGGASACFMDLRATGQTKSKMTRLEKPLMSPGDTLEDTK